MRVAILLNPMAGRLTQATAIACAKEIVGACRARGLKASAHLCDAARLTETARKLAAYNDAVIAAGGDGTVSAVAAGLIGRHAALGVVPLGTLNHFAKDLGVRDLETAIDAIAAGHTARIDVGEVNGRVFINNSSIGLYPEAVLDRNREQRRGTGKWSAMLRAAMRVLLRFPLLHVAIALAGSVVFAKTPFVFVGNNEYVTGVRELGTRKHLDRGRLGIYTIRATSRLAMLWSIIRALVRRHPPNLEAQAVERIDIVTSKRSLRVAVDGEVVRMRPPLTYKTRPGALTVLSP